MKIAVYALTLSVALGVGAPSAFALSPSETEQLRQEMVGTLSVEFFPMRIAGALTGCSLVYKVAFADYTYKEGALEVAVGNITVLTTGDSDIGLSLKIGTRPVLDGDAPFEAPAFAYIQTSKGSTANVKQVSKDGDPGYRLFMYTLQDSATMQVFRGLIDSGKVEVGFNRKKKGLDVILPIELDVTDVVVESDTVVRRRSPKAMMEFADCNIKLLEEVQKHLGP